MTSFHKPVVKLVPGMMALGVLGESIKLTKKPIKPKKLIKGGAALLIGIGLIKPVSNMAASI